jgi:AcrR family transcriptional regulator
MERRKARTRAALLTAAQQFLAQSTWVEVSVAHITEAAGVGVGSFYNHFDSKDELFDAAVRETLDQQASAVAAATQLLDDPAEKYAVGVRTTGRLSRTYPVLARVMVNSGLSYVTTTHGLGALALRDLTEGMESGRFAIDDPELLFVATGGAVLALLSHLDAHPDLDAGLAADELARAMLRMCGLTRRQAAGVVARPLPQLSI